MSQMNGETEEDNQSELNLVEELQSELGKAGGGGDDEIDRGCR